MSSYTLVVFLHISAAVALLATSIVGEPIVRSAARRARTPQELRALLQVGRPMAAISPVAALLILASGAYLSTVGRFWTLGWIQVSTALWVVNSVVAVAVVRRAVTKVEKEADATTEAGVSPALDELRWSNGWSRGLDLLATNDAVTLALMTLRPTLGGSLLLLFLANAAVAGGRGAFGVQRPRATPAAATPGF